jgi:hypothetical protein
MSRIPRFLFKETRRGMCGNPEAVVYLIMYVYISINCNIYKLKCEWKCSYLREVRYKCCAPLEVCKLKLPSAFTGMKS